MSESELLEQARLTNKLLAELLKIERSIDEKMRKLLVNTSRY
jgi:hypothetical protein